MVKEIIKSIDTHFAVRSSATSLCFSFLICKMELIRALTSSGYCESSVNISYTFSFCVI